MKGVVQKGFSLFWIFFTVSLVVAFLGVAIYFYHGTSATTTTTTTTFTVAGSGSAGFALENWAKYYEGKNSGIKFDFLPSTDAVFGIQGVKEGTLDLGVSSRDVKPEEEFPGLMRTVFARDAVVFVTNSSVAGAKNLTDRQLVDIYTGRIVNWREVGGPDAEIIVVDREETESSKRLFRKVFLGAEEVADSAVEVHSEKDVLSAVISNPDSIGYLSYGRAKLSDVNILSVNGIGVVEGMRTGAYPLVRDYYVFLTDKSPEALKDFVLFLKGDGRAMAEQFFYFKP